MKDGGSAAALDVRVVLCSLCGKAVTPAFTWPRDQPFVVRAWVECPECLEKDAPERTRKVLLDAVEKYKSEQLRLAQEGGGE